jgi:hypothetical protein
LFLVEWGMARRDTVLEDGRVWDIDDIIMTEDVKNSEYSLAYNSTATLGPTAGWWLFEIVHSSGGHRFRGRWDENKKYPLGTGCIVDIDKISTVRDKEIITKHFSGHHTDQLSGNGVRAYKIDICDEGKVIFQGSISFRTTRRLQFAAATSMSAAVTTSILR